MPPVAVVSFLFSAGAFLDVAVPPFIGVSVPVETSDPVVFSAAAFLDLANNEENFQRVDFSFFRFLAVAVSSVAVVVS